MAFKESVHLEVIGLVECVGTEAFQFVKDIFCEVRNPEARRIQFKEFKIISGFWVHVEPLTLISKKPGVKIELHCSCSRADVSNFIENAYNILKSAEDPDKNTSVYRIVSRSTVVGIIEYPTIEDFQRVRSICYIAESDEGSDKVYYVQRSTLEGFGLRLKPLELERDALGVSVRLTKFCDICDVNAVLANVEEAHKILLRIAGISQQNFSDSVENKLPEIEKRPYVFEDIIGNITANKKEE